MEFLRKFFAATFMFAVLSVSNIVNAALVILEPDDYSAGTDVTNFASGATLSVNGAGGAPILVGPADSMGGCGGYCASTGIQVFYTNVPDFSPHKWQFGVVEFRVDFDTPTDFVSLDFAGIDNGDVQLIAFNKSGIELDRFVTYLGAAGDNQTGIISLGTASISYILAGGVPGEGVLLDNLQYNNLTAVPIPAALYLFSSGLFVLVNFNRFRL